MDKIKIGVLAIGGKGKKDDKNVSNIITLIKNGDIKNGVFRKLGVTTSKEEDIKKVLTRWSESGLDLILTIGGVGLSDDDTTPEATKAVLEKTIPGISYLMLKFSSMSPLMTLSRGVAGVKNKTLIINLLGSESEECLQAIADIIPTAVHLIHGRTETEVPTLSKDMGSHVDPAKNERICVSLKEAQDILMDRLYLLRKEKTVSYQKAEGHVLAQDVIALDDLPPFRVSKIDGYAIRTSDKKLEREVINGSVLEVTLLENQCVRINAGMALPLGADTVVSAEPFLRNGKKLITVAPLPSAGENIQEQGSDFRTGQILLKSGTYLDSFAVGLIAASGTLSVRVFSKPRVAVIFTGNELVNPGEKLKPGKVRDTNRVALLSLLEKNFPGVDLGIVSDDQKQLQTALEKGFQVADVVITTGNKWLGERPNLKEVVVTTFPTETFFSRVLMKPIQSTSLECVSFQGKPKLWFDLRGDTNSILVASHVLLLPGLKRISGWDKIHPMSVLVEMGKRDITKDMPQFIWARTTYDENTNKWTAELAEDQRNITSANSLVELSKNVQTSFFSALYPTRLLGIPEP